MSYRRTTSEERTEMVQRYLAGEAPERIVVDFGCSRKPLQDELRRRGIETRHPGYASRKLPVDETFFDVIDTEEKAYWLGFLSADGRITGKEVRPNLQGDDVDHLHKLASALKSGHRVVPYVDGGFRKVRISITSKRLADALHKLGLDENKSCSLEPCRVVPIHLLQHYWRGLFDGDGGICPPGGKPEWQVRFCGTPAIVAGFRGFVNPVVGSSAEGWEQQGCRGVGYSGPMALRVLDLLYGGARVWLDRKKALVDQALMREAA